MMVLHHFANPTWFSNKGGWTSKESTEIFQKYAKQAVDAFGDLVDSWNTINERMLMLLMALSWVIFPRTITILFIT